MKLVQDVFVLSAALAVPLFAVALLLYGIDAVAGLALGFMIANFGILGWALLGVLLLPQRSGANGARLAVSFALLKAPLLAAGTWAAISLGSAATAWFLVGLALVYSSLVLQGFRHGRSQS